MSSFLKKKIFTLFQFSCQILRRVCSLPDNNFPSCLVQNKPFWNMKHRQLLNETGFLSFKAWEIYFTAVSLHMLEDNLSVQNTTLNVCVLLLLQRVGFNMRVKLWKILHRCRDGTKSRVCSLCWSSVLSWTIKLCHDAALVGGRYLCGRNVGGWAERDFCLTTITNHAVFTWSSVNFTMWLWERVCVQQSQQTPYFKAAMWKQYYFVRHCRWINVLFL